MKKLTLILIYLSGVFINIEAQCIKTISTKPSSPVNTEFDALYPPNLWTNPFKNTFNWGSYTNQSFNSIVLNSTAGWSISGNSSYLMHSPYSTNMPSTYFYLNRNGALPQDCDWHWEDGWELLWMNTGYYPNGEGVNTSNPQRIINGQSALANPTVPYIFLYNRYTGKVRMFSNLFTNLGTANNIQAIIKHSDNSALSGVFRHLGNYDQALDQKTVYKKITSYNQNPNNSNQWFSADFQMGFDPCVCDNTIPWSFDFEAINTFSVNLYGRSLATSLPLGAANTPDYSTFLTNSSINTFNGKDGGSLLYKSLDGLYNAYKADVNRFETDMKEYNAPLNVLKRKLIDQAKDGLSTALVAAFPEAQVIDFALMSAGKIRNKTNPFNITSDKENAKKLSGLLKDGFKGLVGKGVDFMSSTLIGNQNEPVLKTQMPTATFSEMRITGDIVNTSAINIAGLYCPGSVNGSTNQLTAFNYPAYNKPLGLFALLKSPAVNFYHKETNSSQFLQDKMVSESYTITTAVPGQPMVVESQLWDVGTVLSRKIELMIKLKDPLLYKFNKNLDFNMNKTDVYVCFQVEYENTKLKNDYYQDRGYSDMKNLKGNMSLFQGLGASDQKGENKVFTSEWEEVKGLGEHLLTLEFTDEDFIKYKEKTKSRIYPQSQIPNPPSWQETLSEIMITEQEVLRAADNHNLKIKKITMKLMPDMYFNQIGSNNGEINTTQVFTYLLYDDANSINTMTTIAENQKSSLIKYTTGTLTINNEQITTTKPYVTSVSSNIIYVDAEKIEIGGTISVMSGYSVELRAYEDIISSSDLTLTGPISLILKKDFYNFGDILEGDDNAVTAFCQGANKKYQANIAAFALPDSNKVISESSSRVVYSTVYPNPTPDRAVINIYSDITANYKFKVLNVSGQEIIEQGMENITNPRFEIDLSDQAKGIYVVVVYKGDEIIKYHKIVKL
jgi:hypothetical protein